jgi:hypothetical protein
MIASRRSVSGAVRVIVAVVAVMGAVCGSGIHAASGGLGDYHNGVDADAGSAAGDQSLRTVRAWQSIGASNTIPEHLFLGEQIAMEWGKPTVGLGFSGGGSRAFINAIGSLAALHELQMIKFVDYITGISGVRTAYDSTAYLIIITYVCYGRVLGRRWRTPTLS